MKKDNFYLNNLDFIKVSLMICVIMGHAANFWKGNWFTAVEPVYESKVLSIISDFLNSFHIYSFTFVSGYLFYFLKIEKGKYNEFIPFIINKAKRLLVPYFFVCIVWVIPIYIYFFDYDLIDIIHRYLLGVSPNQLWFLLMLFWVYLLSISLSSVFAKHLFFSGAIVCALYISGMFFSRIIPNYFMIWRSLEYVLYFYIGFEFRKYETILAKVKWFIWIILFLFSFIMLEQSSSGIMHSILNVMTSIFGSIAGVAFFNRMALIMKGLKDLFDKLKKYTMPMYLFHQQLIYFSIFLLNGRINGYLNAFINFIVGFLGALIISFILMKHKVTRFLIGES